MAQIQTPQSLVKYSNPILTTTPIVIKKIEPNQPEVTTEDILNSILPPRTTQLDKHQLWQQTVSPTPATKQEVLQLQENLDKRLIQRQARETGICPIREELYNQAFDELIRQITINCSERGLLLVRIRDEIRSQIATFQTLYESATGFGMRQNLLADLNKLEMNNKIKDLEIQCGNLEQSVNELENEISMIQTEDQRKREKEEEDHKSNMEHQQKENDKQEKKLREILDTGDLTKPQ